LDEAIKLGYNFILTHHPIIFSGIKRITGKNHTEKCLIKAIKNDLVIYAGHTNVDSVRGGVNDRMADKLKLNERRFLTNSDDNQCDAGLGIVGYLPKALSEIEFLELVQDTFLAQRIKHSKLNGHSIHKVALCGGAGSSFLETAKKSGADVFLTGESKYHEFFVQADDILLVDAGHYETEQYTKEVFFELLSKKLPTFAVRISVVESNPVHYF
jgi:dinuclear metal center YbgI/SA1388 family protein